MRNEELGEGFGFEVLYSWSQQPLRLVLETLYLILDAKLLDIKLTRLKKMVFPLD